MKLTLAGAAIGALFASFTQGLLVLNEAALEQVLFWLAGSVAGRNLDILASVFPYMAVGTLAALMISPKMNVLAMGDDVAKGLGLNVGLIKLAAGLIVIFLAGKCSCCRRSNWICRYYYSAYFTKNNWGRSSLANSLFRIDGGHVALSGGYRC